MKVIKRALHFDRRDWKHVWWLFKNMWVNLAKGDLTEAYDAWMWIVVHFSYDSTLK